MLVKCVCANQRYAETSGLLILQLIDLEFATFWCDDAALIGGRLAKNDIRHQIYLVGNPACTKGTGKTHVFIDHRGIQEGGTFAALF